MILLELILYILVGLCAGFFGGLLGIGGGLVTVPALVFIFHWNSVSSSHLMQMAIGTSLAAMVFTAASSAWAHVKQKGVIRQLFLSLSPGIVIGSMLGAVWADHLNSHTLKLIFGTSVCLIGTSFLFPPISVPHSFASPSAYIYFILGVGIGLLSTLLGIGGGILTVPLLTYFNVPLRNAISTSAATGFVIAFVGAVSFLFLGMKHDASTESMGYVYLPAFFVIGIISVFSAPVGAKLAYILPVNILRKVFGAVLIVAGLWILGFAG